MRIFQHNGAVKVRRGSWDLMPVIDTTEFIVNQVKVVTFPGIVPQPEIG
jgi:hypothetical protein